MRDAYIISFFAGDDLIELIQAEIFIGFGVINDVGVLHHLLEFIIVEGLTKFPGDAFKALDVSNTVSLGVPHVEHLANTFPRSAVTGLRGNDLQELVELYGSVDFSQAVNHFEHDLASSLQP